MNIALIIVTAYLLGPVIAVAVLAAGRIEKLSRGLYAPVRSVSFASADVSNPSTETDSTDTTDTPYIDELEVS